MKREFVIEWFEKNSAITREEIERGLDKNIFEQFMIDSFAFLELIGECEEKFGFTFSEDDFASDAIFTIEGLVQLLESR